MKLSAKEIKKEIANASAVETYTYKFVNGNVHSDNLEYIGNSNFDNSEVDMLPFDDNGEVDVDIFVMNETGYNLTICANTSEFFSDSYDPKYRVAVIIVNI